MHICLQTWKDWAYLSPLPSSSDIRRYDYPVGNFSDVIDVRMDLQLMYTETQNVYLLSLQRLFHRSFLHPFIFTPMLCGGTKSHCRGKIPILWNSEEEYLLIPRRKRFEKGSEGHGGNAGWQGAIDRFAPKLIIWRICCESNCEMGSSLFNISWRRELGDCANIPRCRNCTKRDVFDIGSSLHDK